MSSFATLPRLEVANAHFVTPNLLTGGDLHHDLDRALDQLDELVEAGVTHIIDNRIEWSDEALVREHAPHLRYLHNPADDRGQRMDDAWFDDARAFARAAWIDPDAKVLAHCHMGINRGPSIAYSLLLDLGWNHLEAFDAIRSARDIAHMGYAEDALDHHLRSVGAPVGERRRWLAELAAHRRVHDFDVREVIRRVRSADGGSVDVG
jgi:hypothetical protein